MTHQNLSYSAALRKTKPLMQDAKSLTSGKFRIAIGGNCSARFLVPGVLGAFADEGIDVWLHETDYDSWVGDCLAPTQPVDAWIIWISAMGISNGGLERREANLQAIGSAAAAALDRGERMVVILPETMDIALDGYSPMAVWNRQVKDQVRSALPDGVLVLDPDTLAVTIGGGYWYAPAYWSLAKLPLHADAANALAYRAASLVLRSRRAKVKAVVVDLDNTLWGGVIGEDGVDGIKLDPTGDGRPFLQLQAMLKDLSNSGVMIAVASKNNPADARLPFEQRPEMILSLDDFVAFHVSWDNKHKAIRQIAKDLNIGIDSICFLDDSPHERSEAAGLIPELIVPELPEDAELRPRMLVESGLFLRPRLDAEDRSRVEFYKSENRRRAAQEEVGDIDGYLKSLGMRLTPYKLSARTMPRVASLLQKTNQFNLTTRRHDLPYLQTIAGQNTWFCRCYSLNDRFGDAGIIGVLLAERIAAGVRIDTWLMSCRVINRQVEYAMLDDMLRWMSDNGDTTLLASYIPTKKNAPVASLLPDIGMNLVSSDADGQHYSLTYPTAPAHHINIEPTKE